ncbi:RHS repeat-associated core domain-containing protein [Paucibacter sp. R3-3]|uniref:RHS repeat-associated core domain-containing protein n=1 Tax=Roseateles agri TaxID=3098619 RepID=A0ABU5DC69_9BURK|nr:RHS repeat-associated core domain-containing protein [Paucibacter sp. R3-3]MDY0743340.1 RHS repeat-associated core domain-containing protein [Paucibacter sp. R3-3]
MEKNTKRPPRGLAPSLMLGLRLGLTLSLLACGGALAQTTTTVTRTIAYEYDAYGQLQKETTEPGNAALQVVTQYAREPVAGADYGLISKKTLTWQDPASGATLSRDVQTTGYDARGRFALSQTNAKQQTVSSNYDDGTGAVLNATDPNLQQMQWQYDGWGRKTRETRPDGTATSWAYRQCTDSCGWAVAVTITQQWSGTSQTTVPKEEFSDASGRVVLVRSWGLNAEPMVTETSYSSLGYTAAVSRPRFQADTPVWTYYDRDDIGRVTQIRAPSQDGSATDTTQYVYDGRLLTMTDARSQVRVEERNGLGKLKAVTDALGWTTRYIYDGFGNLVRTLDAKGNQIDIGYDKLGRKVSLSDPDLGSVQYWVDPLGQTWKQQDAKAQVTTFSYDELGRLVQRLEPDQDSRWDYDGAAHGVGKLAEAYTVIGTGTKDYRSVYGYDALSRPSSVTTSLDWDYISETLYDGFGRSYGTRYTRRTRGGSGGVSTLVYTSFNAQGYADKTYRQDGSTSTLVWQQLAIDGEGHSTRQQLGASSLLLRQYNRYTGRLEAVRGGAPAGGDVNASQQDDTYQYDVLGNLIYRAQLTNSATLIQESFEYDELNRLETSQLGGVSNSFSYDTLGNLKSKAHVGTYAYPASGAGAVRPHALSAITGTVAGLVNPGFSYDANGNLVSGLNRSYAWTAADQPRSIDKLSAGVAVQRTEFVYGPDHQRVKQQVSTMSGGSPQASTSTIFYAGAFQKEIDATANVTIIRISLGDLGYVEERLSGTAVAADATATRNARLFLKDHLDSVIGVMDEAGTVLQRMSYDAWGRRRNPDGSDDGWDSLGTLANNQDNSGFTGHEQLDQLGLVDMNARMYDPITGRHTSADPTVPNPADQQAFNRYSYVLNNALIYTDPTGLAPELLVFASLTNPLGLQPNQVSENQDRERDKDEAQKKEKKESVAEEARCKGMAGTCAVIYPNGKSGEDSSIVGKANKAAQGESASETVAQLPPSLFFARPPIAPVPPELLKPGRMTPLEELPEGSAGGPGEGKYFPKSLRKNTPEGEPCGYCGTPTTKTPGQDNTLNLDHVVPRAGPRASPVPPEGAAGAPKGNNSPENKIPSCRDCNLDKSNRTPRQWYMDNGWADAGRHLEGKIWMSAIFEFFSS